MRDPFPNSLHVSMRLKAQLYSLHTHVYVCVLTPLAKLLYMSFLFNSLNLFVVSTWDYFPCLQVSNFSLRSVDLLPEENKVGFHEWKEYRIMFCVSFLVTMTFLFLSSYIQSIRKHAWTVLILLQIFLVLVFPQYRFNRAMVFFF